MKKEDELIKQLKGSNLYAECPCGGEFKLSDAILFDGTKPFPSEALEKQKELLEALKEREKDLKKKKNLATDRAENTAMAVNLGKKLEVILPTMKDFKWSLADCRFLGEPIDFITFNGFSNNNIHSLSFVEVKSGGARLNGHQKAIKEAVEARKVSYKLFK
ncbi:hypothetical protein A3K73_04020 [Candidatus Pacearchaeota archaeon RBG_13_36_9]|nr:MAG: hypothetical protein A3K73_04020 [Candidatus Pacearchaeota archaeon RBG_13_36_9]